MLVEGQKSPLLVPKKIIKSEYLENSDKTSKTRNGSLSRASSSGSSVEIVHKSDLTTDGAASPQKEQIVATASFVINEKTDETRSQLTVKPSNMDSIDLLSHCSAAGTCFSEDSQSMQRSSRVFVFPEDCPGYELLENCNTLSSKFRMKSYQCINISILGLIIYKTHTHTPGHSDFQLLLLFII